MSERLQYQGRLAEKDLAAEGARLRLQNLRNSLRQALDLFEPVESLDAGLVMALAADFAQMQADLKALLEEIAAIKKVLGR